MVGIVIESAEDGNSEQNHIKRFIEFLHFDTDKVKFYKMKGKGNLLNENEPNYKIIKQEIDNKEINRILFI